MLLRHSPNNVCYSRIVRFASIPNNIHLTLVLLAYAFLLDITVHSHLTTAAQQESVVCPPLIALSTSEARHLLAHLFWPTPTSAPLICQWSIFRRTHQYWAGYY